MKKKKESERKMSAKCQEFSCRFNIPVMRSRSARSRPKERKSSGHSKQGRRTSKQVSGRCLFGYGKQLKFCPIEEGKK